jgi:hypothetical protein
MSHNTILGVIVPEPHLEVWGMLCSISQGLRDVMQTILVRNTGMPEDPCSVYSVESLFALQSDTRSARYNRLMPNRLRAAPVTIQCAGALGGGRFLAAIIASSLQIANHAVNIASAMLSPTPPVFEVYP